MKARPVLFSTPMISALLDGRKTQTRRVVKPQPQLVEDSSTSWELRGLKPGESCIGYPLESAPAGARPFRTFAFDRITSGRIAYAHSNFGASASRGQAVRWGRKEHNWSEDEVLRICPYGKPGDLLWVRETWAPSYKAPKCQVAYAADGRCFGIGGDGSGGWFGIFHGWLEDSKYRGDRLGNTLGRSLYQPWKSPLHMPRWASRLTLELTGVRVERLQDISEADASAEGIERRRITDAWGVERDAWALPEQWAHAEGERRKPHEVSFALAQNAYGNLWNSINGPGSWDANPWVWAIEFKVHQANVDELLMRKVA